MALMKPIARAGGFGVAGLAASKGKTGALAAVSPTAALIAGSKKKPTQQPQGALITRTSGVPVRRETLI